MSELLTVADVARYCRIHEVTVRRHIAQGRLPAVRVGRFVRVRQEDLEAYAGGETAGGEGVDREGAANLGLLQLVGWLDDPNWDSGEPADEDKPADAEPPPDVSAIYEQIDRLIVGLADSPEAAWVSTDKYRALAEAYESHPA